MSAGYYSQMKLAENFIRRMSIEKSFGMVLKENSGEEIRSALICMAGGKRFLCHQITNLLVSNSCKPEEHSVLTATETDILRLVAHGKSVKEIAVFLWSIPFNDTHPAKTGISACFLFAERTANIP